MLVLWIVIDVKGVVFEWLFMVDFGVYGMSVCIVCVVDFECVCFNVMCVFFG